MLSRLTVGLTSRLSSSLSIALFSSNQSSSSPSSAQIQEMVAKQLVEDTISNNSVVIFSKSYCPYCMRVKSLFDKEYPGLRPAVLELDERNDGSEIQNYLLKKTGQRTVPSVFVNKTFVGGNDDTQTAFKTGKLAKLLDL